MERSSSKQSIEKTMQKSPSKGGKSPKKTTTPIARPVPKNKPKLSDKSKSVRLKSTTKKPQLKGTVKQTKSSPCVLSQVKSNPSMMGKSAAKKSPLQVSECKSASFLSRPKSSSSFKTNSNITSPPIYSSDNVDLNLVQPFFSRIQNSKTASFSNVKCQGPKSNSSGKRKRKTVTKLCKILTRRSTDSLKTVAEETDFDDDVFEIEPTITSPNGSQKRKTNTRKYPPLPRMSPTKDRGKIPPRPSFSVISKSSFSFNKPQLKTPDSSSISALFSKSSKTSSSAKSKSISSHSSNKSKAKPASNRRHSSSSGRKHKSKKSSTRTSSEKTQSPKKSKKSKSNSRKSLVESSPKTQASATNTPQSSKSKIKSGGSVRKAKSTDIKRMKSRSSPRSPENTQKLSKVDKAKVKTASYKTNTGKTSGSPEGGKSIADNVKSSCHSKPNRPK